MYTYKTSQIAELIGIHPNTVRLYEDLGLIPKPKRQANGYRIFTDHHVEQFRLARRAFQIEVLQNGLRKKMVKMVKTAASGDYDKALQLTQEYIEQLQEERNNAEEAIGIVKRLLYGEPTQNKQHMKRKEVSEYLHISMDTLRNWEMNGLLSVKRKKNGYRIYRDDDILQLKIIRSLRCANYSLESILRMLHAVSLNPNTNLKKVLNTPTNQEDIISVCDKLIDSLNKAESNAQIMINQLQYMKNRFR
ncbi:MerR family transcriptional regulator [Virgibacillus chiguensis]|uniref:DNA-binding transcriptional regulator, MerR family n=1 Tax=Virgibacillus chiguensis TaxID=411959 RepID=A0A1M5U2U7_9BACI|nr:MerR family transcriptional regulator [Virgibacillus chiguensis]SHH57435.1 DNA-binding transcriptional regulator, MerR family [Virgibacillus chiguensis]